MLAEKKGLPKSQLLTNQILNKNQGSPGQIGEEKYKTRGQILDYALADDYDSSVRNIDTLDQDLGVEEDEGGSMSLTIVTRE